MLTLREYESYKDSGVKWLGVIPRHWKVGRLRQAVDSCDNGVWGSDPNGENDYTCIRVADFTRHNYRTSLEKQTKRKISRDEYESHALVKGDLLLEKSGGGDKQLVGQIVSFDHDISAVCSNFIARLRINQDFDSRFIAYFNAFLYSIDINYKHIKQTTGIQNLDSGSYLNEWLAYPALEEQERIAQFLDKKMEVIDDAIAKKQRLIELLQEQKAILINNAVTKGLDPDVPLRESGVEWIGRVPSHWEVKRIKYLFEEIDNRTTTGKEILFSLRMYDGLVPHDEVSSRPITDENVVGYKIVQPGQFVMNRMRATVGLFAVVSRVGLVSPDYAVFNVAPEIDANFYLYLFKTSLMGTIFRIESKGIGTGYSGFLRLYTDRFGSVPAPVPPKYEQTKIVQYFESTSEEFAIAIDKVYEEISLLEELKRVLISDAVTGKIKI